VELSRARDVCVTAKRAIITGNHVHHVFIELNNVFHKFTPAQQIAQSIVAPTGKHIPRIIGP
jgi:hypothetical protein